MLINILLTVLYVVYFIVGVIVVNVFGFIVLYFWISNMVKYIKECREV